MHTYVHSYIYTYMHIYIYIYIYISIVLSTMSPMTIIQKYVTWHEQIGLMCKNTPLHIISLISPSI